MIKTETVVINGKAFTHTYSDADKWVVRDGVSYSEAYDPAELGRTYIEGEPLDEPTAEEIMDIIIGGAE